MRLSKRQLVGIGLATSLAFLPGCSESRAEQEPTTTVAKPADFNPRVQALAGRILELTPFATGRFTSKPPFTYGFSLPTNKGGMVTMSTQLSTRVPDSSKVSSIQISQTGIPGYNYDLSLLKMPDNTWSAYCSKDGDPANGISEDSQKRALLRESMSNQTTLESPSHAEAVLKHYIEYGNNVADLSQSHMPDSEIEALDNACGFNLGDGS